MISSIFCWRSRVSRSPITFMTPSHRSSHDNSLKVPHRFSGPYSSKNLSNFRGKTALLARLFCPSSALIAMTRGTWREQKQRSALKRQTSGAGPGWPWPPLAVQGEVASQDRISTHSLAPAPPRNHFLVPTEPASQAPQTDQYSARKAWTEKGYAHGVPCHFVRAHRGSVSPGASSTHPHREALGYSEKSQTASQRT